MPSSCCVIGCKSRGNVSPGIVFFQLPLNKGTLLSKWLIVLDRVDWVPKQSHRICSLHFLPDDYITQPNQGNPRLKPDAVPSVFPDLAADEEDAGTSEEQKEKDLSPKLASKGKSTPVSTPVTETPSGRPRRIPKVNSKMKDFILFDDSLKRHRASPAATPQKGSQDGDNKAAQELLSILEDSSSLSGDEKHPGTPLKIAIAPTSTNNKMKPAPASVKRARLLAHVEKNGTKPKESVDLKNVLISKAKGPKTDSLDLKNTVIELNSGEKVIYLSYADLNPVADMTKNNVLLKDLPSLEKGTKKAEHEIANNNATKSHCPSPFSEDQTIDVTLSSVSSPKRKIKKEKDSESASAEVVQAISDVEVCDADSGAHGSLAPVAKVKKIINAPSPINKKKRFKTVAEIVVRTDNTGEVPNVSIEKMTTLKTDTPKKKNKISSKPIPPIQNLSLPVPGEDDLYNISDRVAETVKQMKKLDAVKNNASKLTVLVTTLHPVEQNDILFIKKKNILTETEKNCELRVCVFSQQDHTIPVVGMCGFEPKENNIHLRKASAMTTDTSEGEVSAPLQHDHTYISPSLKIGESDILGEDPPKELLLSKLKLSEEEISYRNKIHKKLRFLKETVKRKNETINKMKQKIACLEKSLRDERKVKKKLNLIGKARQGFDPSMYDDMAEGDKSLEFHNADLSMDFEEGLDESEDEERAGSRSPITYICEPAIDVCEKPVVQE